MTTVTAASTVLAAAMRPAVCIIRVGKPDDLSYVTDSWTKHAFRGERMSRATEHVRALLARPTAALYVAHVPGEPDAILGWALLESGRPTCLQYVYVRAAGRRQGVARALLSGVVGQAIEYAVAAPKGVAVPRGWTMNARRAET